MTDINTAKLFLMRDDDVGVLCHMADVVFGTGSDGKQVTSQTCIDYAKQHGIDALKDYLEGATFYDGDVLLDQVRPILDQMPDPTATLKALGVDPSEYEKQAPKPSH